MVFCKAKTKSRPKAERTAKAVRTARTAVVHTTVQTPQEIAGLLTAISIVSRRLAGKISALDAEFEEGGDDIERRDADVERRRGDIERRRGGVERRNADASD